VNEVAINPATKQFLELALLGPFDKSNRKTEWKLGKWVFIVVGSSGDKIITFGDVEGGLLSNNPKGSDHWFYVIGEEKVGAELINLNVSRIQTLGSMFPSGEAASFGIILLEGDQLGSLQLERQGGKYIAKKLDKNLRTIIANSMKDMFVTGENRLREIFIDEADADEHEEL